MKSRYPISIYILDDSKPRILLYSLTLTSDALEKYNHSEFLSYILFTPREKVQTAVRLHSFQNIVRDKVQKIFKNIRGADCR